MDETYIVAVARTAGGRRNGRLKDWHPADLGGEVLNALVGRSGIDPAAVDDVIGNPHSSGARLAAHDFGPLCDAI